MKKIPILGIVLMAMLASCRQVSTPPRPTIPLVYSVLADTTGAAGIAAGAGNSGADGSIAIIGEPADGILLAKHFVRADAMDNISGRPSRDSLADFAGETFDVLLDAVNAPYTVSVSEQGLDSLREAAVANALFAWDSTCYRSATDSRPLLRKQRAKILVFTSSMQARYGLFDVDTLQQLAGGKSLLLSPVKLMLEKALDGGARNLAVWSSSAAREAGVWEAVFEEMETEGRATLTVLSTEKAVDIRTEFRDFLRQYRASGKSLDALLLDSYQVDAAPLQSEISIIRRAGSEEDRSLDQLLSPSFFIVDPVSTLVESTYALLRSQHLFTHKIALPAVRYYESETADDGEPILVEAAASYVQRAYVSDFN